LDGVDLIGVDEERGVEETGGLDLEFPFLNLDFKLACNIKGSNKLILK